MFEPQTSIVDIFRVETFSQARKLHEGRDTEVRRMGGWVGVCLGGVVVVVVGWGGRVQIYVMGIIKGFLWVQNNDFAMR